MTIKTKLKKWTALFIGIVFLLPLMASAKITGWTEAEMALLFDALDPTQTGVLVINAEDVVSTATGDIVATDVDAAIAELESEKVSITGETGAVNLGGAASFEIPNGTDPDVTVAGQISNDTDGANVTGDVIVRGFDGTNQWAASKKLVSLAFPFTTAGTVANWQPWLNDTGMTFTITYIAVRTDDNGLVVTIDEYTSLTNTTHLAEVDELTASGAGTNIYYVEETSPALPVIETGHGLSFDFDGAAEGLILIRGWFNADVD